MTLDPRSSPLAHCGNSSSSSFSSGVFLPWQSVVCGHGTRYRNLSCFVSDGSIDGEGSQVDEELCSSLELAVDGDKQIRLKEACILPCPGNNAVPTMIFLSFLWRMGNLVKLYIESISRFSMATMFVWHRCHCQRFGRYVYIKYVLSLPVWRLIVQH